MTADISIQWVDVIVYLVVSLLLSGPRSFSAHFFPLVPPFLALIICSLVALSTSPPIPLKHSILQTYLTFYTFNPGSCLFRVADICKGSVGSFEMNSVLLMYQWLVDL